MDDYRHFMAEVCPHHEASYPGQCEMRGQATPDEVFMLLARRFRLAHTGQSGITLSVMRVPGLKCL